VVNLLNITMNLFFTDSIEYDNMEVRDFGAGVVFMLS
jgi:hypothetical protein